MYYTFTTVAVMNMNMWFARVLGKRSTWKSSETGQGVGKRKYLLKVCHCGSLIAWYGHG